MGQGYMNLEAFMEQLRQLGIYGSGEGALSQSLAGLGQLTGEEIGGQLASTMGLSQDYIKPGMFSPLSDSLVKGAQIKTYSPRIQATQANLLSNLMQSFDSPITKRVYGKGFADTGAKDVYGRGIKSDYGRGMTKELTNIYGQQTQSQAGLFSWLQQQLDTVKELQGDAGHSVAGGNV